MMVMMVVMLVVVMMMFVLLMIVVVMFMMVMVVIVFILILFFVLIMLFFLMVILDFIDPCGRGGHTVEVEETRVQDAVELDIAIVAVDNLSLGLQGTYYLTDAFQFLRLHLGCLVQQDDVAELDLLDDEILQVVLVEPRIQQGTAAAELVLHAQGIYDGDNAVQHRDAGIAVLLAHRRDAADGLRDGSRFADAAGFDDDVVKGFLRNDVMQLLYEVHLQGAADTTVLQGDEAVVLLADDTALLNQVGIDVHLADVIHYHGKAYAALVGQNAIE